MCKFVGRHEKHEMRQELEFEVKKKVKLQYSSQPKKSLEEWMSDSEMCNGTRGKCGFCLSHAVNNVSLHHQK